MFNKLTYKQKNKLIFWGTPLVMMLLWFFVFSNTWTLFMENMELRTKIERAANAPEQMSKLQEKIAFVDQRLSSYVIDSVRNREYLLFQVSEFCKGQNLILREFPQVAVNREKDLEIETNKIVAEGNYIQLLKLLYDLEQVHKIGRPASVSFVKNYDNKRKKQVLTMSVYIQNIRILKNENK